MFYKHACLNHYSMLACACLADRGIVNAFLSDCPSVTFRYCASSNFFYRLIGASLHCALSLAAQCIVIGSVCGYVCVGSVTMRTRSWVHRFLPNWVCITVVTASSWLNFGRPCAPGKMVCGGAKIFWLRGHAARSVCVSPSAFFILVFLSPPPL